MERDIAAGKENGVRHIVTNHIVEAHEGEARYRFYIIKMNVAAGPVAIATAAGDCLVSIVDGEWRFSRFQLTIDPARSEEHTSELQSLMRISYAVFCLKKKKKNTTLTKNIQ